MAALVEFKAPLSSPVEYVEPHLHVGQRTTARVAVVLRDRTTAVNLSGLSARLRAKLDPQDESYLFDVRGVVYGASEDGIVDFDLLPVHLPFRALVVGLLTLHGVGDEVVGSCRLSIRVEGDL